MIKITLNGEPRSIPPAWCIDNLLQDLEINNRYCAVERNQTLVPREEHAGCAIQDGDQIEVVTLVGGG